MKEKEAFSSNLRIPWTLILFKIEANNNLQFLNHRIRAGVLASPSLFKSKNKSKIKCLTLGLMKVESYKTFSQTEIFQISFIVNSLCLKNKRKTAQFAE